MSPEYRYIEAKQLEAGQEFGRMLRRWRELNNWTQYTAYKWAKEAGFEVMAPSTLSGSRRIMAFKIMQLWKRLPAE